MHRTLIATAALIALSACGDSGKTVAVDDVAAEAGQLAKPRPGQYETKVELVNFEIPGMPAQQAEQLKSSMGQMSANSTTYCLTQAEADKGFEDSVRKMTEGSGAMKCEFKKFDVNGGKLAAALTCNGPQSMAADITIDGTATTESSDMQMKMVQKASMIPGGEMHMEMKMNSKRVGDCA